MFIVPYRCWLGIVAPFLGFPQSVSLLNLPRSCPVPFPFSLFLCMQPLLQFHNFLSRPLSATAALHVTRPRRRVVRSPVVPCGPAPPTSHCHCVTAGRFPPGDVPPARQFLLISLIHRTPLAVAVAVAVALRTPGWSDGHSGPLNSPWLVVNGYMAAFSLI